MRRAQALRLIEAPLPARSSSARSGCYSVNKVLRELSLLANYASLFRATSLRHILDDELQLGPPPAPPPPLTSEESRTAGCVVAFVIAELRAPSRSCTRCRWFHAPPLPLLLARAASSASRVPSAWRPSRPRGPAPAVHACPRQRLGLGRSALVGDVAAAARREPRRRPDGKSVRSCESSPGAVCCVLCAVQHGEVALFWTLVRSPLESI